MVVYIKMGLIAIFPLTTSVLLHFFFKRKNIKYWPKQIIVGVIFGGLAIVGTEFGVPLNGAVLNARDAAPLCAGLIFGGPAGVIAGLIGGIERWFCVYWGGGTFTRVACSVATIISGLIGAFLKKYMFDNKIPNWQYALAIGLVAETIHMTMVFVTNGADIYRAFLVVKTCTLPMLSINSLAVTLAVMAIDYLDKDDLYDKKGVKISLSQQFQRSILIVVVIVFALTSIFTLSIQNSICDTDTKNTLSTSVNDLSSSVESIINEKLLDSAYQIKSDLAYLDAISNIEIAHFATKYDVDDINIVNSQCVIDYSNHPTHVGVSMYMKEASKEFICLNETKAEYAQEKKMSPYTNSEYKYVGVAYINKGFIQVGIEADRYKEYVKDNLIIDAYNRHIGENGGVIVFDENREVLANSAGINNEEFVVSDINTVEENKVYKAVINGTDCYCLTKVQEGCCILAYIPCAEATFTRDLSIYFDLFMETIIFAIIFVVMYFLVRYRVVLNIQGVNDSLKKITEGDLNEVVNTTGNQEFASLSNGINVTVEAMKHLIDEANKRIDSELSYAKQIQESSLPTYFEENEYYDLYASMNPAKEVGGDFYDFYTLNNRILVITVADVSGKGIPAALFMMRAKSILKTYAEAGIAIADIFTNANYALCEGNDAGLFVTAWMGFVDLYTGEVKFANAGHNMPLIKHKDSEYEYLKSKAGFVLGGMDSLCYEQQSFYLNEGDEIFLYTDGASEATNISNELFGDDRLRASLNKNFNNRSEKLCRLVKEDIDEFVSDAPQFDDITMLSLKINKLKKEKIG